MVTYTKNDLKTKERSNPLQSHWNFGASLSRATQDLLSF